MIVHELIHGRLDLHVHNEATALVIASRRARARYAALDVPAHRKWDTAVRGGLFLPIELMQDESFDVRVVLGDLAPGEEEEWIGRVRARLSVSDGVLALCAGTDFVEAGFEGEDDDDILDDTVHFVAVPPGDYTVTIDAHLPGVNGSWLLPPSGEPEAPATLAAWFRATRPGMVTPSWYRRMLDDGEGRERDSGERAAPGEAPPAESPDAPASGLSDTRSPRAPRMIGFVIALRPARHGGTEPELTIERGLIRPNQVRRPELAPLGLVSGAARDTRPHASHAAPVRPPRVEVAPRLADAVPELLVGEPIAHPVGRLWQVYRLAFYCNDSVDCEIVVRPAERLDDAAGFLASHVCLAAQEGDVLHIGFPAMGMRWELMDRLRKLEPMFKTLPDGAVVELLFADENNSDAGRQRWSGRLVDGDWMIEATFPAVDRATLETALAFSASVDGAEGIDAPDEIEGDAVLDAVRDDVAFSSSAVTRDGRRLTPTDTSLIERLAQHVFQRRFGAAWPLVPLCDPAGDSMDFGSFALSSPRYQREMEEAFASRGDEAILLEAGGRTYASKELSTFGRGVGPVLAAADAEAAALGWTPFGNMVSSLSVDTLVRAYSGTDRTTVLIAYFTKFGPAGRDLVTSFANGAILTTTNVLGVLRDDPGRRVYRQRMRNASLAELIAAHEVAAAARAESDGAARPAPRTLAELAAAFEEFTVRALA